MSLLRHALRDGTIIIFGVAIIAIVGVLSAWVYG